MKMKMAGRLLAALAFGVMCACGSGKQEAAVALDDARLSVSAARKAGAEFASPARLAEAVNALSAAEGSFGLKNYAEAQSSAQKARDAALLAAKEAADKSKVSAKTPARAKRRAGRK